MDRPAWAPTGVDIETPSIARVYDYFLGGSHNFAADRALAEQMIAALPQTVPVARENRAFLGRAVRFIAGQGVDQFVDIGSGIPTVGNVHEVAASVHPGVRVVYVDNDPVAIAHSRALLADVPGATIIGADMLAAPVLGLPELRAVIDLDRPVGVLLAAVLHFVTDGARARDLVAQVVDALPPGSFVAISHASDDNVAEDARRVQTLYNRAVTTLALRTREEITALFDGLSLVDPGVVELPRWRPEHEPADQPYPGYAGVGRVD